MRLNNIENVMSEKLIIDKEIAHAMGYKSLKMCEKKLIEQGITPIYGRHGRFFVTAEMLNKNITTEDKSDDISDDAEADNWI